jgi:hypothetical protein
MGAGRCENIVQPANNNNNNNNNNNTFLAIYLYLLVEGRCESNECPVPTKLTSWEIDAQCNSWHVRANSAR